MRPRIVLLPLVGLCLTIAAFFPVLHPSVASMKASGPTEMNNGLQFRLSDGAPPSEQSAQRPPVQSSPLGDPETAALLGRLTPIKTDPDDQKDFALRDRSLPPPLTGAKVIEPFNPKTDVAPPDDQTAKGPLEVVRYAPEGDVPIAPHLSVTFSQPMVDIGSQEEAATHVPVELSPKVPGHWRWVGTKTLLFEPDGRFPMATDYKATVPAGTRSVLRGSLAAAKTWAFSTPPLQLKNSYPGRQATQPRNPLMFMAFDQRIDPDAVVKKVRIYTGTSRWNARLATEEQIKSNSDLQQLAKSSGDSRWLAFVVVPAPGSDSALPLPGDSNINVSLDPGAPSAEGPRLTQVREHFGFHTYGPLKIVKASCGYPDCRPFQPWSIQFNNSLDEDAFNQSMVRVTPALPDLKCTISDNTLMIQGASRGRTKYQVTIDASLKDTFGQTLQKDQTVSFEVQPAEPSLFAPKEGFVVADPFAQPRFSVYSVNYDSLKVSLYSVGPEDWDRFRAFMMTWQQRDRKAPRPPAPGRLLESKSVPVQSQPDETTETRIDLTPGMKQGHGSLLVIVEPPVPPSNRSYREGVCAWVQVTDIGLDAFADNANMTARATSLKDGRPVEGVRLQLQGESSDTATASDGMARLRLPGGSRGSQILIARKGADLAILPQNANWWYQGPGWTRTDSKNQLRWYVFDDRGMYRPGEQVHVKGWIRQVGGRQTGDVGPLGDAVPTVWYQLKDSRGNEVAKGSATVNAFGGFDAVLKLPDAMNLGMTMLNLDSEASGFDGSTFMHTFQVQEFRRPEFEVSATASDGPHFVGDSANVTVNAHYYAGGALPDASVDWRVTSTPGSFTPPNRGDFSFGEWIPWWTYRQRRGETHTETFTGHTDVAGNHNLRIDFDSAEPPTAYNLTAEATVYDVNRQAWTTKASMLVHPADLYVGLRSPRTFVQKGDPLVVQSIVTDLDGKAVAGRTIVMEAVRLEWVLKKGQWSQEEVDPQECSTTSGPDAVECRFKGNEGGEYRVTATVTDERSRQNQSSLTLWVAGGKLPPKRDIEEEEAVLIPSQKTYQPGDTAEILVQSPWPSAEGVLTVGRSGIVSTQTFKMDSPTTTLRIPIEETYTPNIVVTVKLVGSADRAPEDASAATGGGSPVKRPAFAGGSLNLEIPPRSRTLTVTATPKDLKLEPGGETSVDVQVKDSSGNPVAGSEVALVVVDESILALSSYKLEDPLKVFYAERPSGVSDFRSRADVLLANPADLLRHGYNMGGGGGGGTGGGIARMQIAALPSPPPGQMLLKEAARGVPEGQTPVNVRSNFDPLATFAPSEPTDSNGHVTVKVTLPDNLTRYRVMAVSVAGAKQFGSGESSITARLPLMVRPSPPRFLNFGDRFELPVVVQNQTDSPMQVEVAVRATNASLAADYPTIKTEENTPAANASEPSGVGQTVTVPANDRVELRFPAAAVRAGTARFQVVATSGKWADAASFELPVWTPATTEAFATYGEIDSGAIAQQVLAPSDAVSQFGGLEISTSSTELQSLTDAVIYLTHYPFECSEQISSRVIAISALRDVLSAFHAKGLPNPEALTATVDNDIKRLKAMQNEDGGFAFWRKGDQEWPYLGIYVAHALERARVKKFSVPSEMLDKSRRYLREIDRHIPAYYGPRARRALDAYALYVRNLMSDKDPARARQLITEEGLGGLSMESIGWLLPVLSDDPASRTQVAAIRQYLNNHAEEEAGTAHFTTSYSDGDHLLLHSDRRDDGVILDALIGDQPSNDLIPKIVRGLLAHRTAGRWDNTQENAWVLLALDRYFNTYEKATPNFTARAWLGDAYAGGHDFKGRTTERTYLSVPMAYLMKTAGPEKLVLSKEGTGRLYYRVGMDYAPANLSIKPADYGFAVSRTYEAVDNPSDVHHDPDGTWHIKAGATVRVRLTMAAQARRYHVALVDPIPAGLEALNPELAVTGDIPQDPKSEITTKRFWWWTRPWFEHQNMRDERVEAFTSLLWDGVYNYSYVARATTPGVFVVPPPKAEEMYHPETFGRGGTDRVIVE